MSLPAGTIALPTRLVDVSSTEIRERIRKGKSLHGFVPESVGAFIETERLYR
jgi:nicotinic acid mononucleotide adenylyltransferase